ncbi:MAG: hypothetical protein K2Q22_01465 [Cytophagales bacterium]|nr:hypothetical protein [Cytophagales bacterium]
MKMIVKQSVKPSIIKPKSIPTNILHTWISTWQFDLVFLVLVSGLYVSKCYLGNPSAFSHPQFIAEDGCIFYQDAYNQGFFSVFNRYAGYWDIVIRLVAYFSTWIDILYAPAFFVVSTYLLMVASACYLYFRIDENKVVKIFVCSFYLLGPFGFEVYLWLTMSHFLMGILLLVPFLWPNNKKSIIFLDVVVMLLIGLNGPYSVILLPVLSLSFIWFHYFTPKRIPWAVIGTTVVVASIQIYNLAIEGNQRTAGLGQFNWDNSVYFGTQYLSNNISSILGTLSTIYSRNRGMFKFFVFAYVSLVALTGFTFYRTRKDKYFIALMLFLCLALNSFSVMYAWKELPFAIVPPGNPVTRYLALSTVALGFGLIILFNPKKLFWIIPLVFYFFYCDVNYRMHWKKKKITYEDLNWAKEVENFKNGKSCSLMTQYKGEHFVKIENCQVK